VAVVPPVKPQSAAVPQKAGVYPTVHNTVAGLQLVSALDVLVVRTAAVPQPDSRSSVKAGTGLSVTHTCMLAEVVPQGFDAVRVTVYVPGAEKV